MGGRKYGREKGESIRGRKYGKEKVWVGEGRKYEREKVWVEENMVVGEGGKYGRERGKSMGRRRGEVWEAERGKYGRARVEGWRSRDNKKLWDRVINTKKKIRGETQIRGRDSTEKEI